MQALKSDKFKKIQNDKSGSIGLSEFNKNSNNNQIRMTNGQKYTILSVDSPEFEEYQRLKKKNYYHIEKDIQKIVSVFNISGFKTFASCQGHGIRVDKVSPYISFYASTEQTAALEKKLRQDSLSDSPELLWNWYIEGTFDSEYNLSFSLRMGKPKKWYYKYSRKSIQKDFNSMIIMIKK